MKSRFLSLFFGLASVGFVTAQEIVEPDVGQILSSRVQDLDPESETFDGAEMGGVQREFMADLEGEEVWVALGQFRYGIRHRFTINMQGSEGQTNGVFELASLSQERPHVFTLHQLHGPTGADFEIYSYPIEDCFGLVVKFIHLQKGTPTRVRITHAGLSAPDSEIEWDWKAHTPQPAQLSVLSPTKDRLRAGIEQHRRSESHTDESSLHVQTSLDGQVRLRQPQGDLSMGPYGPQAQD